MELKDIRAEIDRTDDELLKLFLHRMDLAGEVAKTKKENGSPIQDKTREREILAKIAEKSGDMELYSHRLFFTLIELSKTYQHELMRTDSEIRRKIQIAMEGSPVFPRNALVACQGTEGANSQEACDKLLPRGNIVYVKTFQAVFDAVESGLCRFGVLPVENSSIGSVRSVYDLLAERKLSIVRSTKLNIRHELLCNKGAKISDIREIYTHEQAISQCSRFLHELKDVKVIPCANTAVAAKMIAESGDIHAAAISSHRCAELYGLDVLNRDIQDSENNYTRFICIEKNPVIYEGASKISLIISCDNKPGALFEMMAKPSIRGINMNKLESCPVSGRNFEFMFIVDLEASVREPGVITMLEDLEQSCESMTLLGCYAEV